MRPSAKPIPQAMVKAIELKMKLPTLPFGSLCDDDADDADPQCKAGDRLRAVAEEAEEHEHRECRQDGNESARGDPVVDE